MSIEVRTATAIPRRTAGVVGCWAGAIGVISGLILIGYPAAVEEDGYSYPFDATGFAISQVVLAARDAGLVILLAALWTAVGRSVLGRIGIVGSVLAMTALAVLEVAAIVAESSLGGGFGLASTAIGVFMILTGIAVLRTRAWTGWQRYLPLALGIYVFVPLTPGILAGFVPGQVVIAGWMALYVALGRALLRR